MEKKLKKLNPYFLDCNNIFHAWLVIFLRHNWINFLIMKLNDRLMIRKCFSLILFFLSFSSIVSMLIGMLNT